MKTDISEELKMGKRKNENQIRRQKADFQPILDILELMIRRYLRMV